MLRYGLRRLAQSPLFTIIAVLTLALGSGVNSAIFSVTKSVLLESLPYGHPNQLVMVWTKNSAQGIDRDISCLPRLEDWKAQSTLLAGFAGYTRGRRNLTGGDEPEQLNGADVTANFFRLMEVKPVIGRVFDEGEDRPGREGIVVISHGLWARRFGADPNILGRRLLLNGRAFAVVGVMPQTFQFPARDLDYWTPLIANARLRANRDSFWLTVVARIKPGVAITQAQQDMDAIARRLEAQHVEDRGLGITLVSLKDELTGNIRLPLLLLTAAVFAVLLIACSNVAGMLMARAAARQREIAIRAALGAGRGRVVRQLLVETLLLFIAGGTAGLLLAVWGVQILVRFAPAELEIVRDTRLDPGMVAFTLLMSLITGIIFGIGPAMETTRTEIIATLKLGSRTIGGSRRSHNFRRVLIAVQFALAIVLLCGAALLIRSFLHVRSLDYGFKADHLLTARLQLPRNKYSDSRQAYDFFLRLLTRIRGTAGVQSAGATSTLLFGRFHNSSGFSIEGRNQMIAVPLSYDAVTPEFFRTMGTSLLKGRFFTDGDHDKAPPVAIINPTAAQRYWPNEDPIGKRFKFGEPDTKDPWVTIVGVVADTRRGGLESPADTESYQPHAQFMSAEMTLVVRTIGDPLSFAPTLRTMVKEMDRDQPVAAVAPMERLMGNMVSARRFHSMLLGLLALTALILACAGLYGVITYVVTERRKEIGIRMALGAQHRVLLGMLVGQGLVLLVLGALPGLITAFILARMVSSLLYGVTPLDPLSFLAAAGLLFVVALTATYLPARRATKVDPMIVLRHE